MRFRIIEDCRNEYPVRVLCDALGVSPSGYYAWRTRPESPRQVANRQLLDDIRRLHADHRERYGAPCIHAALRAQGRTVSRGRVERLMHRHGLRAQRLRAFRVCTTDSNHALPFAPNLLDRNFTPTAPNQVWLTDITDVPTDEGWVYLAVVLDLFSRKAIGGRCAIICAPNCRWRRSPWPSSASGRPPAFCTLPTADANTPRRTTARP
ncbi:IS3 family transposase [Azospirillum argentinense]|uniref:IS3 family transposase n=1 Tax=Azospirillum brasilense TaxID=192 RepID=A0A4D8PYT3_AZOBR|nr:IS3 family transposase [Azospirillum argentinense]